MSEEAKPTPAATPPGPGLSPGAVLAADWLRDLSRTAKTARLYQSSNPVVEEARLEFARATTELVEAAGGWTFRITPEEILLDEELIIHPPRRGPQRGEAAQRLIAELPFRLYRDGVRELTILPGIPRRDVDALVDALALSWTDRDRADDIVTALWQANPTHIRVDAAPAEQPLFVATGLGAPAASDRGLGLGLGLPPLAAELRVELGDRGGAVGLHRESGLEEKPPVVYFSAESAYEALQDGAAEARDRLVQAWEQECSRDWHEEAWDLFARIREADSSPETAAALARFVVTGVANAIDRGCWVEATEFLHQLGRLDPEEVNSAELLRVALASRSELELGEVLDGASAGDLDAFFALLLALGANGVPLALSALAGAQRSRTRAAACAALTYLCANSPQALAGAIDSRSPNVVRHVVSVLGHIGGHEAGALCAIAARHAEGEVTREVARSVPAFPDPERTNMILDLLVCRDSQSVLIALRSARRERNPRVAEAIMKMIEDPEFADRSEELRRTMFQTLADVGDASIVPTLEAHLTHGGWLARPSWLRTAVAHTLAHLGLPEADAAVQRGRSHRSEAVRAACREMTDRNTP